jgi:hypothetical protein
MNGAKIADGFPIRPVIVPARLLFFITASPLISSQEIGGLCVFLFG